MKALEFYRTVTRDEARLLERLLDVLDRNGIRYCVIGGQAVNAYVAPLVSLDLDIVIAVDQIEEARILLERDFQVREFPHSLNVSVPGSELRVQVQTDPRYSAFIERAAVREVLGTDMPVASAADVLQGKVWAASDDTRRSSKRRKDVLDIERLLDAYPDLRSRVPQDILDKLL